MEDEHILFSRKAAREGAVLLKNDGLFPLERGKVVMLGKGMADYVKGGGGSGDVSVAYTVNMLDGMRRTGFEVYEPVAGLYERYVAEEYAKGAVPGLVREPRLEPSLMKSARGFSDTAIIVFSRFSGENWDRSTEGGNLWSSEKGTRKLLEMQNSVFEHGDFYLSDSERLLLEEALDMFPRVGVILNAGGIMDTSWIKNDPRIGAALHAFQGGEEGGLAAAELIAGLDDPSGRLTDTYAESLDDYPSTEGFHESLERVEYREDVYVGYRYFSTVPGADEKVLYPFGYGLSYTSFRAEPVSLTESDGDVTAVVRVTNTGERAGRDVVELYASCPRAIIDGPSRVLCGFEKTSSLEPGEEETVTIRFSMKDIASFDDEGIIERSSWILEKGEYTVLVTDDALSFTPFEERISLRYDRICGTCRDVLAPKTLSARMRKNGEYTALPVEAENELISGIGRREIRVEFPGPEERRFVHREGEPVWSDVKTDDDLVALVHSMDTDELIDIVSGEPNRGLANTFGIGNETNHGVPSIMTADGPAGIRFRKETGVTTTGFPCATLIASTWDRETARTVGKYGAEEAKAHDIGAWLAPAVNIHRSPLCGRNFEYWSEDPLLTGKMAAAFINGVQGEGVAACIKHFACNDKETDRKNSNSVVSQRALREIYLRQFEIAIAESDPWMVMSSYNWLNGIRTAENRELLTAVLREDWGYEGMVVTDWWNHGEQYLELLAGNDHKMAIGYPERVKTALENGDIRREDIEKNVLRILRTIRKIAR